MSALIYIRELRNRALVCFLCFVTLLGASLYFYEALSRLLSYPIIKAGFAGNFIYTGFAEAFVARLHTVFFAALCGTMPVILIQVYLFVAPALYPKEKIFCACILFAMLLLFSFGFLASLLFVFPWACKFLMGFQSDGGMVAIHLTPKISEYTKFFIDCMTAFGLAFQMPVLMIILMRLGVISYLTMIKYRRAAIVTIFLVSAILTPPDVVSQIALAIPMLALYEISLFIGRYLCCDKKSVDKATFL